MRLICPNCSAQYDVPIAVIPNEGRDVQCSNCAHTWFQAHPDYPAGFEDNFDDALDEALADPEVAVAPDPLPVPPTASANARAPESAQAAPPPSPSPQSPPRIFRPERRADGVTAVQEAPVKQRRIDPEIAEILREERDFEAKRRAAEDLRSSTDVGPQRREAAQKIFQTYKDERGQIGRSDDAARSAVPNQFEDSAQPDVSRDKGLSHERHTPHPTGSRRDLLPDVEAVNQTLKSQTDLNSSPVLERSFFHDPPKKSGFGRGFWSMVVLAIIGVCAYIFGPQASESVPQIAPYVDTYVETVDGARGWLDHKATQGLEMLDSMSSEASAASELDTGSETEAAPEGGAAEQARDAESEGATEDAVQSDQ